MVRIEIRTRNIAGDEELLEALRTIADQVEEGEVEGSFAQGGEDYSWAVNPAVPEIE